MCSVRRGACVCSVRRGACVCVVRCARRDAVDAGLSMCGVGSSVLRVWWWVGGKRAVWLVLRDVVVVEIAGDAWCVEMWWYVDG